MRSRRFPPGAAAQQLLRPGYPAAKANVDKLVDAGILSPMGEGRYRKSFAARGLMTIVEGTGSTPTNQHLERETI